MSSTETDRERLLTADQVIVIAGAGFDVKRRKTNRRLAVERSTPAIAELVGLLLDHVPGESMDWMEWPEVSVAFLRDRQLLAEHGILAGTAWVRTDAVGDREVRDPGRLRTWLTDRGVSLSGDS